MTRLELIGILFVVWLVLVLVLQDQGEYDRFLKSPGRYGRRPKSARQRKRQKKRKEAELQGDMLLAALIILAFFLLSLFG